MLRFTMTVVLIALTALGVYAGASAFWPRALPAVTQWATASDVPTTINHQGVVSVSGVRFSGTGQFRFAILDVAAGLNLWTNDGTQIGTSNTPTASVSLAVTDGIYNVRLGNTSLANMTAIPASIFSNGNTALRIWLNDGTNGTQQLTPDSPFCSSPYAMTVADGSITSTKLAATLGAWAKSGSDLSYTAGNVGVGTASPGSPLTVKSSSAGTALSVRNTADNSDTFAVSDAGAVTASSATFTGSVAASTAALTEQASAPSNPAAGSDALYADTAQNLFLLTSGGEKRCLNLRQTIAEQNASLNSANTTPTAIPGTDMSLAAGTYLLFAHFWARSWVASSPGGSAVFHGDIYNATDNSVIKDGGMRRPAMTDTSDEQVWDLFTTVTLSATKTIRLRGYVSPSGSNFASGFRNDSGTTSDKCRLLAIKISE